MTKIHSIIYLPKIGFVAKSLIMKICLIPLIISLFFVGIKSINIQSVPDTESKEDKIIDYIFSVNKNIDLGTAKSLTDSIINESINKEIPVELILGVITVESRFKQYAMSGSGAMGFMQVIPKWHMDKLAKQNNKNIYDPVTNISIGSQILFDCIKNNKSLNKALGCFNGSKNDQHDKYAKLVLNSVPTI